jgi:hypothetical protein
MIERAGRERGIWKSAIRTRTAGVSRFAAALVAVLGLALGPAAVAHGPGPGGIGYISTAGGLVPHVPGVLVRVLGGDDRLRLANHSGKAIVVSGYEGEPFLRFDDSGIYENLSSPATYLSRERDPRLARVPATADPKAPPRWRRVGPPTRSYVWHDHRIHWTEVDPPPAVERAPDEVHKLFDWRIPARADGRRFVISGFLGWVPAPVEEGGDGTSPWLLAGAIGAGVLALGALGLGARRARRRTP